MNLDEEEKRKKAWVGDAVLALYARQWVLEQKDIVALERKSVFIAMTSNRFLACIGEPTMIEAKIGIAYEEQGLEGAFNWISEQLMPVFKRQRLNQLKAKRGNKKK